MSNKLETTGIEILGYGHYLPRRVVTNEEILGQITIKASSVDNAVLGNIAVTSRHWADEDETINYMAEQAIYQALEESNVAVEDIDLLILSNWTDRVWVPDNAPQIATSIGAKDAYAFDVCTACCGFMHGINIAMSLLLRRKRYKIAVVVSSEHFSRGVRPKSKGQLITGDGAGAVVLKYTGNTERGIVDCIIHNNGELKDIVAVKKPECWVRSKTELGPTAAMKNTEVVNEIMSDNGVTIEDINWFVPHPGTDVVHEKIRQALGLPEDKFITNYTRIANTSSASIPIVLSENTKSGEFKKNDIVLSCGVGSGFYYGAMLYVI